MRPLLILVLIAMIFVHPACTLSIGPISASNDAQDALVAGGGHNSGLDLPVEGSSASLYSSNELGGISNKDENGYRIASSDLASDLSSKLDRLGADEVNNKKVESDLWIASSDLGSYSAANLNRLLSGIEASDKVSGNDILIASSDLASDLNSKLDGLGANGTNIKEVESDFWISSSGLGSDAGSNLDYLLSERGASGEFAGDDPSIADFYIASYAPSDQSHLYKYAERSPDISSGNSANLGDFSYRYEHLGVTDKKTEIKRLLGSPDVVHDIDSSFDYFQVDLAKEVLTNDQRFNSALSSARLGQFATSSGEIGYVKSDAHPDVDQNLNVLIQNGISKEHIVPYRFGRWDAEQETGDKRCEYTTNYAVVVGINSYTDWSGLHTAVNDANEISEILEACGYEVVELTDETDIKPTKENILGASLDDIKTEQNKGNIVFYFSGHGVRDDDGTFYLVPQDAKRDDLSSCISELELRGYLRDLDNLAVIIDACNSGDLNIAGDGQLVLTSSKKDEPSNEKWFGSLSVFTYNLCNAIEGEMLLNGRISLNECFYRARDTTVQWSNRRLLSQTPEMIDLTGGNYYIK